MGVELLGGVNMRSETGSSRIGKIIFKLGSIKQVSWYTSARVL